MKEVILSHDSEAKIYLVPDEIADNLDKYCWDFAANPEQQSKFVKGLGCYDYEIPEAYKFYPKYNF